MSNCQDMLLDNDAHAFPVIAQTILLARSGALLIIWGYIHFRSPGATTFCERKKVAV